jgi:hypothetical protein
LIRYTNILLTIALLGCDGVLGIDGQFESTPQAFCSGTTHACGMNINAFDESNCEQSVTSTPVKGTQYVACAQADAGCYAFVHCLDTAVGACPFQGSTIGMPCTNEDQQMHDICCSRTCNAPEGGVGTCQ